MAHAHNVIIRGLNSIVQQAPYVPSSSDQGYDATDVKDLLFYVQSWVKMVNHHHWVEESFIFPEMEKVSGRPGLMDDPRHQHELFHPGMERLLGYCSATTPEEYRWEGGMKDIIDSFSKELTDHLYAEIDVMLKLNDLDSLGMGQAWDKAETIAKQAGNIAMLVSLSCYTHPSPAHILGHPSTESEVPQTTDPKLLVRRVPLCPRMRR